MMKSSTRATLYMAVATNVLMLSAADVVRGQQGDVSVGEVRFEGATGSSDAYLLSLIESQPGTPFSQRTVDDDVVRLLRAGRFLAVTPEVSTSESHVDVLFRISPRLTVTEVVLEGNRAIGDKTLLEEVPLHPGDAIDGFAVREGADNILRAYRAKGFGYAVVDVDQPQARETGRIVYRIEEGPKVRVRKIFFEGNTAFPEKKLKKQIRTRTAVWIFRSGEFDQQRVEDDVVDLQRFYRNEGFLDARVSYRMDNGEEPGDLWTVFTIVEGDPYLVERVRIEGNTVLSDDEISAMLKSQPMLVTKQESLDADVQAIQTAYGERGHIYSSVRAVRVFSETPGFVDITYQVVEGESFTVGRIVVRGNALTQDKVVRRAIGLYPGDTFNLSLARAAEKQLQGTQLFDRATVTPVGDKPGVRDILMNVDEPGSNNSFIFGFGVTSNAGLIGSIVLDIKNFDIFDTPRSFEELVKLRAFRGAGQRMRIEMQPGTQLSRYRLDFTEPYLFDRPLRFDVSLYNFSRFREGFNEKRTGGNVSFGRRLDEGLLGTGYFKDWYGEISAGPEIVDIGDVDVFDDRSIRDVQGDTLLLSVKSTLVRDRTDLRFLPTSGDRLSLSFEQFVGDFNFGRVRADYTRYWTVDTDAKNRKSVFSIRVNTGYILGDAPVFEKFYAGGIGSLRGFEFRGVGPRGGLSRDPIGGEFMVTTAVEYSFPLVGEILRGVLFTDMGTVEKDFELTQWRASVGFGVRLTVEFFGPLPIEIDFAAPIMRDAEDEERIFSFFIGGTF